MAWCGFGLGLKVGVSIENGCFLAKTRCFGWKTGRFRFPQPTGRSWPAICGKPQPTGQSRPATCGKPQPAGQSRPATCWKRQVAARRGPVGRAGLQLGGCHGLVHSFFGRSPARFAQGATPISTYIGAKVSAFCKKSSKIIRERVTAGRCGRWPGCGR